MDTLLMYLVNIDGYCYGESKY